MHELGSQDEIKSRGGINGSRWAHLSDFVAVQPVRYKQSRRTASSGSSGDVQQLRTDKLSTWVIRQTHESINLERFIPVQREWIIHEISTPVDAQTEERLHPYGYANTRKVQRDSKRHQGRRTCQPRYMWSSGPCFSCPVPCARIFTPKA